MPEKPPPPTASAAMPPDEVEPHPEPWNTCPKCGQYIGDAPAAKAATPPAEVHINTRDCEPMTPGASQAIGEAVEKLSQAFRVAADVEAETPITAGDAPAPQPRQRQRQMFEEAWREYGMKAPYENGVRHVARWFWDAATAANAGGDASASHVRSD